MRRMHPIEIWGGSSGVHSRCLIEAVSVSGRVKAGTWDRPSFCVACRSQNRAGGGHPRSFCSREGAFATGRADCSAGVHRHDCCQAVPTAQKVVASLDAHNGEACPGERGQRFRTGDARAAAHAAPRESAASLRPAIAPGCGIRAFGGRRRRSNRPCHFTPFSAVRVPVRPARTSWALRGRRLGRLASPSAGA